MRTTCRASVGGRRQPALSAIPVIELLARQDASVGWCSGTVSLNSGIAHAVYR